MGYYAAFHTDPNDAMLRFGGDPMRARSPWFTDVKAIDDAMCLPDVVVGHAAEQLNPLVDAKSIVADADVGKMLKGLSPSFRSFDQSFWHCSVDGSQMKNRTGDAAGLAMARIGATYVEHSTDPELAGFEMMVQTYEVPLVAQIIAPVGGAIDLTWIGRFVLALRQVLGFNITSFASDQYQSASMLLMLAHAGLVCPGMRINPETRQPEGLPQPFSVDGHNDNPYKEFLAAVNAAGRVKLPRYEILRREMRGLEHPGVSGYAPDHSPEYGGASTSTPGKDTADAVASAIGYLAAYGHAELRGLESPVRDAAELRERLGIAAAVDLNVADEAGGFAGPPVLDGSYLTDPGVVNLEP